MDAKKRFPIFSWLSIGCLVSFTLVRRIFPDWYNEFFSTYQERTIANVIVLIVALILLVISIMRKETNFWNRLGKKTFIIGIVAMSAISISLVLWMEYQQDKRLDDFLEGRGKQILLEKQHRIDSLNDNK